MKAVQLTGFGDAVEHMQLADIPEPPSPARGQILVGMEYAPINFNDLMIVWGKSGSNLELPAVIGNEGAGLVLQVGDEVASVAVGDRVSISLAAGAKTYQDRLIVPATEVAVDPPEADPQQASMMSINPVTASLLLSEYVHLTAGDTVVFDSATSGLSQWLIALAKERGLRSVGFVRRQFDVEKLIQRGCDFVIPEDESIDDARNRLKDLHIPLGFDVLGGPAAGRVLELLSPGGKLVVYGEVTGKPLELPSAPVMERDLTVVGFSERSPKMKPKITPLLKKLVGYLGPNGVTQPISHVYMLGELKQAVAQAASGKKVLLAFEGASAATAR